MNRFKPKTAFEPTEPKPIPERKTLHLCMVCQRQLTVPGERYCNVQKKPKRDHRPGHVSKREELQATNGGCHWKTSGSQTSRSAS